MTPDRPIVWLSGEVKTPPFSDRARKGAGYLLRKLQGGESLGLPHSRPLPAIGVGCHELRIRDQEVTWRVVYHIDEWAVVVLDVFPKKSEATPKRVIARAKKRLAKYRAALEDHG